MVGQTGTMTAPLHLFNSLTRELETFHPVHAHEVRVYSCGPTVYNYPHIGTMLDIVAIHSV
jgi:cysteinyl-tRNA synthetase